MSLLLYAKIVFFKLNCTSNFATFVGLRSAFTGIVHQKCSRICYFQTKELPSYSGSPTPFSMPA